MWTEWRVMRQPSWYERQGNCRSRCIGCSPLLSNKSDGVFDAPKHALLAATEPLALGGRQAARIQLPLAQDRELVRPRQLRMGHDVLGFGKEGSGVLEHRIPVEVRGCLHHG